MEPSPICPGSSHRTPPHSPLHTCLAFYSVLFLLVHSSYHTGLLSVPEACSHLQTFELDFHLLSACSGFTLRFLCGLIPSRSLLNHHFVCESFSNNLFAITTSSQCFYTPFLVLFDALKLPPWNTLYAFLFREWISFVCLASSPLES